MLARTNRFHGLGSLRLVYRTGQSVRGQNLAIKYMVNERRKSFRCAVVVSKKVSKSAVVRNRIRRRVMEVVRLLQPQINKPYDIVIMVYSDQMAEMPADILANNLKNLLTQAGVIS